jgi:hypothetical protein
MTAETTPQTLTIELTRTESGKWHAWEACAPDLDGTGYGAAPDEAIRDLMEMLRQKRHNLAAWQRTGMSLTQHGRMQVETLTALFGDGDAA